MIENELHVQSAVCVQSGDGLAGIEYLYFCVCLDVAGGDYALAGGLNINGLGTLAVEARDNALNVKNYLGHVFLHTGDSGELVLDTGYSYAGAGSSGKRRKEYPAKRVTKCCAIATLQRLYDILTVRAVVGSFDALYTRLLNFDHIVI